MRVLFWYFNELSWRPTIKTIESAPDGESGSVKNAVAAFIHTEPGDEEIPGKQTTRLIKQLKWLAGKWDTKNIVLHTFAHLGVEKSTSEFAESLLESSRERLESVGFNVICTPFGHFLDLKLDAPGHPLARIYREW